jgi:YD repeat-containing protein
MRGGELRRGGKYGGTCTSAGWGHGGRTGWTYGTQGPGDPVTNPLDALGTVVEETVSGAPNQVRRRVYDGLGRLVQVVEDPASKNYRTSYSYDAADRLTGVVQGTTAGDMQTRTFTYSTAGMLLTAMNPETGTTATQYQYTPGGRLLSRTDARGTMCIGTWSASVCNGADGFDAAGRVSKKTYSDGATPAVAYSYTSEWLTSVVSGTVTVGYEYDPLDRVKKRTQTIAGSTPMIHGVSYYPNGIATETYPSGRLVTHTRDVLGRETKVEATLPAARIYVSGATYHPNGGLQQAAFHNGAFTGNWAWNYRGQMTGAQMTRPQMTPTFDLTMEYCGPSGGTQCGTNNGSPTGQVIGHNGSVRQTYSYDGVGRLTGVVEAGSPAWSQSYGYDRFGNRWMASTTLPSNATTPTAQSQIDGTTNRVWLPANTAYDGAGQLQTLGAVGSIGYEGEGRMPWLHHACWSGGCRRER